MIHRPREEGDERIRHNWTAAVSRFQHFYNMDVKRENASYRSCDVNIAVSFWNIRRRFKLICARILERSLSNATFVVWGMPLEPFLGSWATILSSSSERCRERKWKCLAQWHLGIHVASGKDKENLPSSSEYPFRMRVIVVRCTDHFVWKYFGEWNFTSPAKKDTS